MCGIKRLVPPSPEDAGLPTATAGFTHFSSTRSGVETEARAQRSKLAEVFQWNREVSLHVNLGFRRQSHTDEM
jgi:hypothetical protein